MSFGATSRSTGCSTTRSIGGSSTTSAGKQISNGVSFVPSGNPRQRFDEDKLRILRAIRFGARLGYTIEEETWKAVVAMVSEIHRVSAERIREELVRILTEGQAARGVRMLEQSGLLAAILPEVEWTGYLEKCLERIEADAPPDFAAGVLLHRSGIEGAGAVTTRLRFSNAATTHVVSLIREQDRFAGIRNMARASLKRFLRQDRFEDHLKLTEITALASDAGLEGLRICPGETQRVVHRRPAARTVDLRRGFDYPGSGARPFI